MKRKKQNQKPTILPNAKRPDFLGILIVGNQVQISDYSKKEDYQVLLVLLRAMGLQPQVTVESWCG